MALAQADRIVADIERRFCIRELVEVRWTPERFAENLGRFYGPLLPPGVDKQSETGRGDLLVVVVSDTSPRYRLRQRTIGMAPVNARVFDAKQRYRKWTGGGHLVHATNDSSEAARDLFLLFGRDLESVAPSDCKTRPPVQSFASDLVGAGGWSSLRDLLTAMELCGGYALLDSKPNGPPQLVTHAEWAAAILKARRVGERQRHEVLVAGSWTPLVVSWIGDGYLPAAWQEAILRDVIRTPAGFLVASPRDRFYLSLHQVVQNRSVPSDEEAVVLTRNAEAFGVPRGDYRDGAFVRATLAAYLESLH